jgi:Cys-tRNA(Pro)/Cys-tRNA(Cys) deacylase
MTVNNITRHLDSVNARYIAFELPLEKLSAVETAAFLSVPLNLVYKTIVILSPKGKPVLCVIPGSSGVDMKAVATILGEKKVHVSSLQEAENLTGLQAGGISPLALVNKGFRMILDDSVNSQNEIFISGGQRGLIIRINTSDLIELLHPAIARITSQDPPKS